MDCSHSCGTHGFKIGSSCYFLHKYKAVNKDLLGGITNKTFKGYPLAFAGENELSWKDVAYKCKEEDGGYFASVNTEREWQTLWLKLSRMTGLNYNIPILIGLQYFSHNWPD
ncbi:hypothetical protein ACOMHN_000085 [Nucella lapillus]